MNELSRQLASFSPARRELLELLLRKHTAEPSELPKRSHRNASEDVPLSFTQQRIWVVESLNEANVAYNISTAAELRGALDLGFLQKCFAEIGRRWDPLESTCRHASLSIL